MEERIRGLIKEKNYIELKKEIAEINEQDLAEILEELRINELATVFRLISKDKAVDVFAELDVTVASELISFLSDKEVVSLIDEMAADDATDVLEEMPANIVDKILKMCSKETRKDINKLLNYKEDSAGSIMTVEYPEIKEKMTVEQAIKILKSKADEFETVDICYVINNKRRILGSVQLKDLLFSDNDCLIKDICDNNLLYVSTNTDQEEVANLFQKYDVTVLPVVDSEERLVGIITIDDVLDVLEEEASEDISKMAGMMPTEKPYLKLSLKEIYKSRMPWLLFLMISATFTGGIISSFEDALAGCAILAVYMPMVMGTGGNAGGQASVTIIRALSLGEVEFKDLLKVILKESLIGIICGLTLCVCNFFKLLLFDRLDVMVAFVVCLSLFLTVLLAKIIGAILPILADKLHLDPAVMANPIITTIVDAGSLFIYFQIASTLLGL